MTPANEHAHGQPPMPIADEVATAASGLRLTVRYPIVGVGVMTVVGELDMLTAPQLDAAIRGQLAAVPAHVVLDLQSVRFLGCHGVSCLLQARQLIEQTPGSQLYLAGLITRAVARPLEVTGVLELFDVYPTVTDALAALAGLMHDG